MVLTKSEMEIMDVLWDADRPLARVDLIEHSEGKTWKDSSVHILLNGLLQKKAIESVGYVKRSKTYGRTFQPTMTREEYFAGMVYSFPRQPDIVALIAALLNRSELSEGELDAIADLVSARKGK
jgi:BlaI family penicillinase repressor